jgi:spermidine/putrescine transport system permease protein
MFAWQAVFYFGSAVILIAMTFWTVKSYRLVPDFSFDNWFDVLTSPLFYTVYFRTLIYAGIAATVASIFAFPMAYTLAFSVSPRFQRIAFMLLVLPYFTNYYVRSYSWRFMLEDEGIINSGLALLGVPSIEFQGSFVPTIIGYMGYFFPLVVLLQMLSLIYIDRTYVEAANNLGAGRLRSILTIVIPLARGGIVLGFTVAFMLAIGDYIAPAYLGGGGRPTLSILIVNTIQGRSDFPEAATIAVIMVITLMVIMFGAFRLALRR